MRFVGAVLVYVAVATVSALLLGLNAGGIHLGLSLVSLLCGAAAAAGAFATMSPSSEPLLRHTGTPYLRNGWFYFVALVFAVFALRSFCWLLFYEGDEMKVQSANNLGDLSLHLTYIGNFANGVALWPDSPLYVFSLLRYPAGMDLFNGLFSSIGSDIRQQLAVTGIIASAATFYALYRWGGTFTVAAFLFNGGLVSAHFFVTGKFMDYQGAPNISWKNLALSMFVTQRGLLYALPVGLLLLNNWRDKYGTSEAATKKGLPLWVEYLFYATMPLFHIHTFIALSLTMAVFFIARTVSRTPLLRLGIASLIPATFLTWLTTDHFQAKAIITWHLGWTQTADDELAMPFFQFWLVNFGIFLPLVIALVVIVIYEERASLRWPNFELSLDLTLLTASLAIFLAVICARFAPWDWDNIKLLMWAYFLVLPVLWRRMIAKWMPLARYAVCFLLFFSGFISLLGGLSVGRTGYNLASRTDVDLVGNALRSIPVEARFAAFPTYNHSLLLNGRKVVCGYPGHLWTQNIDYNGTIADLESLMLGRDNWLETAHHLKARYLFWGNEEMAHYAASTRPWENSRPVVAQGAWGAIYDLGP